MIITVKTANYTENEYVGIHQLVIQLNNFRIKNNHNPFMSSQRH